MDGQNYVCFHTAADDSYMNSTANFRGADVTGNTEITVYFNSATSSQGGSLDSVALNITAGTEVAVIEAIGAAMAGAKNPVTKIADDINSLYCHDSITSCGTITVLGGNKKTAEVITTAKTLYSYDSGKTYFVNPGATMLIQLPAAAAGATTSFGGVGWNVTIICQEDDGGTMDNIVNIGAASGEFFQGIISNNDGGSDGIGNGTSHDFITVLAAATSGNCVEIISDGTRMHARGFAIDGADVAFATAAAS